MFYTEDLQSGIATAIDQSKLVACFVEDDGEESAKWVNEYFEESDLKPLLLSRTVLLRLKAGSKEAAFLTDIYPVPRTPTLIIIQNGQLKEYLTSGTSKDVFTSRLEKVLRLPENGGGSEPLVSPPSDSVSVPGQAEESGTRRHVGKRSKDQNSPANTSLPASIPAVSAPDGVEALAESQKVTKKTVSSTQKAQDKGKQKEASGKTDDDKINTKSALSAMETQIKTTDMKYAQMQKRRTQEAKDERARILKRVEDDKAERREREAHQRARALEARDDPPKTGPAEPRRKDPSKPQAASCAIQVRLFDGSTIRSRFPSKSTLREHVRAWVDAEMKEDVPYDFKHVLTPLPNRTISISEEEESLHDVGLSPSATLILVPIKDFRSAYDPAEQNIVSRAMTAAYGLASSGFGVVAGTLGSLTGSQAVPAEEQSPVASSSASGSTRARIQQTRDRDSENHQLYNGNALNFEPRPSSDDDT